jgi:hypothetical protein
VHITSAILTAAVGAGAVTLLAACSGGGSQGPASNLPTSGMMTSSRAHAFRASVPSSGVVSQSVGQARLGLPAAAQPTAKVEKGLFVSNGSTAVEILKNGSYMNLGSITNGINGSDGVWIDNKGNLYVANRTGVNVTEYAPGSSSPTCTYSAGLIDPINVTTDNHGNVYVADFNKFTNPGYIDTYAQCKNTIAKQFSIDKGPVGVAVDARGDIFVAYFNANSNGAFEEFKHGSTTPTPLTVTVRLPAGLLIDKKGNLIADDRVEPYLGGSIDVIAPPYTTATPLATRLHDPLQAALNKRENLLFNANNGDGTVTVYSYPAGTLLKTLGPSNGITAAEGVGESPNAMF